jgi:hypothetical protein
MKISLTRRIDLGAKGFVLKDSALTDIIECIKPSPPPSITPVMR